MIGHTTSAAWMAGVVDALASQKLDVAGMFAELGISFAALADIDARFPTEKVSALWRLAAERSRNPAIGLAAGTTQAAGFEVLGYAMMSSPNLLAGLDTLARYLRLVTEAGLIRIEHETDSSWVRFELYGGGVPVPPQRYQFDLLCYLLTFAGVERVGSMGSGSFPHRRTQRRLNNLDLVVGAQALVDIGRAIFVQMEQKGRFKGHNQTFT